MPRVEIRLNHDDLEKYDEKMMRKDDERSWGRSMPRAEIRLNYDDFDKYDEKIMRHR